MRHRKHMLRHGTRLGVLAASIGALVATGGLSNTAWAQDEEDEEAAEETETDDIVIVTGTRIRRNDFTAPNATSVVTGDDMRALGVITAADMVNQLPNNVSSTSPEANAGSPFNMGASVANLRGLNTFFGTRTLTMVDSRRMVASDNGGAVDMNFIPSALVGRIETQTGGGGATYGADAMAGVVNVILDTNIEGIKLDLGYNVTGEGDGERYNFSFATGTEVLDGRGQFTVGIDYQDQAAINDCLSREWCQRDTGILRNGQGIGTGFFGFGPPVPYSDREDIIFEGEPQWLIQDSMNHTILTEGMLFGEGFTSDCANPEIAEDALTCGAYRFTPDGRDIVPYLDDVTPVQRASLDEEGELGVTPWGDGKSPYASVPLLPESKTGNIFTRFAYELESGIELVADLQYGSSDRQDLNRRTSDNMQAFCVRADNAFLQQGSQLMQDVFAARWMSGVFTPDNFNDENDWAIECDEPPFMGGSFRDDREDGRFDFGPGTVMYKDMSEHLSRENNIESDSGSLTVTATGDLFEGGTWTWETYGQLGKTERNQFIRNWRSDNRLQMALDSVVDPNTGETVCRFNSSDPSYVKWEYYPLEGDLEPRLQPGTEDIADKWRLFYEVALKEEFSEDEIEAAAADWFATISQGCTPFNPFGSPEGSPIDPGALAFAFPSIVEGTDITQNALALSFSGDLHRGIGAGPLQMAAGLDWREEETINKTGADPITARDFQSNFAGVNAFGDDWAGLKTDTEIFMEVEMPLLSGVTAAEDLRFNVAKRRTRTEADPIQVRDIIDTTSNTFYIDSWKATMQWQPVDIMRVRITRSSDTRAPSSRELFQTNTGAQQAGGQNEIISPFRADDDETGQSEAGEQYENISGGNAKLDPETSFTETLGFVFTPGEALPGLEVAIDYYETFISGGIETVSSIGTVNRCAINEVAGYYEENPNAVLDPNNWPEEFVFCNNVQFGTPDAQQIPVQAVYGCGGDPAPEDGSPPIPGCTAQEIEQIMPFTNIEAIASSFVNSSPFFNRGVDLTLSYNRQMDGGGFIYGRVLATRFLEQTVDLGGQGDPEDFADVSGQTGSNGLTRGNGAFGINYSPTPRIRGNTYMSYSKNAWTVTTQAIYTGSGRLNIQDGWISNGESAIYYDDAGVQQVAEFNPNAVDTVSGGALPSWTTFNLGLSYDFARSNMDFGRFDALSVSLNVENVADRIPDFFSGRQAGGLNTTYFSGMGRQYTLSARMEF